MTGKKKECWQRCCCELSSSWLFSFFACLSTQPITGPTHQSLVGIKHNRKHSVKYRSHKSVPSRLLLWTLTCPRFLSYSKCYVYHGLLRPRSPGCGVSHDCIDLVTVFEKWGLDSSKQMNPDKIYTIHKLKIEPHMEARRGTLCLRMQISAEPPQNWIWNSKWRPTEVQSQAH